MRAKKIFVPKGFGFVEVVISMALLGVGIYFAFNGFTILNSSKNDINESIVEESLLASLLESIRQNIALEKIDFKAEETFLNQSTVAAVKASLFACWGPSGVFASSQTPNCPGRLGYVVAPLKTGGVVMRGLYKVTVRLTHDSLFPNEFKQFEFIVRGP